MTALPLTREDRLRRCSRPSGLSKEGERPILMPNEDLDQAFASMPARLPAAIRAFQAAGTGTYDKDHAIHFATPVGRAPASTEVNGDHRRAEKERQIIFEITEGIVTTPSLDEFLKLIHRSISRIFYAENCFVALHDEHSDLLHFEFWFDAHDPAPPPRAANKGRTSYILRTGHPLLLTGETKKAMPVSDDLAELGRASASWIGVPLRTPSRTIGVLVLKHYDDPRAYGERDLELLTSIGDQIALAIERKRTVEDLRESEERYRSVVETASDAIITIDDASTILFANGAAERIFGYTPDEMKGMPLTMLMPERVRRSHETNFARYVKTGEKRLSWDYIELPGMHKSGREVPLELSFSEFTQRGRRFFTGSISDITERKRATEALQASEQTLRELAGELESERKRLVEAQTLAKMGSWHTDLATARLIWSAETHRIFETDPATFHPTHKKFLQMVHPDDRKAVHDAFTVQLGKDQECEIAHRVLFSDGRVKHLEQRWQIVFDDAGNPVRAVGSCKDITERRSAEDTLREAEEKYRSIFENSSDGIFQSTPDGQLISANQTLATIYGFATPQDLISEETSLDGLGHADPASRRAFRHLLDEHDHVKGFEYEIQRKNGTRVWVSESARVVRDPSGRAVYHEGSIRDITGKKRAKEALRRSEERYRELVENATDIIFTQDLDGNYTSINKAAERITGYTRDETLTRNMAQTVAPEQRAKVVARMKAAIASGAAISAYELDIIAKDGRRVTVEVNTKIIQENGVPVGIQGIARDITARKHAESEVHFNQQRYRSLIEATAAIVWERHPSGEFRTEQPGWTAFTGQTFDELKELGWLEAVHPDDQAESWRAWTEAVATGSVYAVEERLRARDRSYRNMVVRAVPISAENGEILQWLGVHTDITEHKEAEAALTRAEAKYRSIFENAIEGIFQSSPDGKFISVNPAMARILGYASPEELMTECTDIRSKLYVEPRSRSTLERTLADEGISVGFECEIYRKDGSKIWIQENVRAIRDEKGNIMYHEGSIEDITRRRALEVQLLHSQKMEAVGVLAGGIAHDFNNLLTVISGYCDLTLRRIPADEPLRCNIQEIRDAGGRAAELTGQLLAFSRKQVLKPVVHNLNFVITELERMLRRVIKENIEFRTVLDPRLRNIKADPGQIEQVIMNLAVNARDAMLNGGTLKIETRNVDAADLPENLNLAAGGDGFVKITVIDTGEGMDEETRKRVFEPFFTTKDVGKGTGLGLSTVYGIVSQSGGDITVTSEIGRGTRFEIYLPCVSERPQRSISSVEMHRDYAGSETVLLVENEDIVRKLVREIMTINGYRVLEAKSGPEALNICDSGNEPIDLLLTDIIMPKMSGRELKDKVLDRRPGMKVLLMSGYTSDANGHNHARDRSTPFIAKPFTPEALSQKIRTVLESR